MSDDMTTLLKVFGGGRKGSGGNNTGGSTFSLTLATIPASYASGSGRPTLQFDGETSATTRTYPYLSSYNPAANDRVVVAFINHSGVILGKIT